MADRRNFFHDILNNPRLFLFIRAILDGGQVRYLKGLLEEYRAGSILDVACGCGTFCRITPHEYLGVDYNEAFISFCRRKYGGGGRERKKRFVVMDATDMKTDRRFDTAVIINSIHHFPDDEVVSIFTSMRDITERLVIVHDAVPRKNPVSRFFYRLDRGTHFRTVEEQKSLIARAGLVVQDVRYFKGTAGIYLHSTVICTKKG
ncbi:MAG: class I SAM-dependent methyltransferase [Spirochaetes bacterium]|nr:class I SAM-dependent methyltransferase [Spirochaetota bacterium]